ncbi:hypothetical protein F4677DRAFT_416551 [Hypoxylon crocopeplum]|nr:hypothetical protein F4677DRAFT_416551 [Hypoxylon crocopeplum]
MKYTTILALLASGGRLGMRAAAAASESAVLPDSDPATSPPVLEKRDAYSCYGSTNTSLSDCHRVIDSIQADAQQNYSLYSNVCAVWSEGTCRVRLCAQPYVIRPVNRTAAWLATYIASPLLDGCIGQGKMGVLGDHPNINSHAGTYRLWVS